MMHLGKHINFPSSRAALIRMFSPYGKIVSEDFLWHTRGPKRGEPRGYAFVQFSTNEVRVAHFLIILISWQFLISVLKVSM